MRKVCQEAIELIKRFESLHDGDPVVIGLQPKPCPAGIWTAGYGHALKDSKGKFLRGEAGKKEAYRQYGMMTLEQAEALFESDLNEFAQKVFRAVRVPLTDPQFGALVSLAFNIGTWNFATSTLLRKLNEGRYQEAAKQFLVWNKSGGKVLNGLVRRRASEKALFESA